MAESPLGRLAGIWELEPFVEGRSAGEGRATLEWIDGGSFLLVRSVGEWTDPGWVENAPKTTESVLGFDDTTFEVTQLYTDDRGVSRIYRGTLTDAEWRLERAAPDFHQRFVGEFRDNGRTIDGRWEFSPDGPRGNLDFPITYRRSDKLEGAQPLP